MISRSSALEAHTLAHGSRRKRVRDVTVFVVIEGCIESVCVLQHSVNCKDVTIAVTTEGNVPLYQQ